MRRVIRLLAERFRVTHEVGRFKAEHALPPSDPQREAGQVARLRTLASEAGLDPDFAEQFHAFVVAEVIRNHEAIAVVAGSRAADGIDGRMSREIAIERIARHGRAALPRIGVVRQRAVRAILAGPVKRRPARPGGGTCLGFQPRWRTPRVSRTTARSRASPGASTATATAGSRWGTAGTTTMTAAAGGTPARARRAAVPGTARSRRATATMPSRRGRPTPCAVLGSVAEKAEMTR